MSFFSPLSNSFGNKWGVLEPHPRTAHFTVSQMSFVHFKVWETALEGTQWLLPIFGGPVFERVSYLFGFVLKGRFRFHSYDP
jgi:hypothetical protein